MLSRIRDPEFWPTFGVPLAFVLMCAVFAANSPVFLTTDNWVLILHQASITGIAAIGATIVLMSGAIDITQGSVIAIATLATVQILNLGVPFVLALPIALSVGILAGAGTGALIHNFRIPAFVAALGAMLVIRGIAFVWTSGISVGLAKGASPELVWLGQGRVGGIPVPIILMVSLYLAFHVIMRQTAWGLRCTALGSDREGARLAGVRPSTIVFSTYMIAGGLSALAGVLLAGRLTSAAPETATGIEFDILTAVVLGGASIYGGRGNVLRTLLGAVFILTLYNGMLLLGIPVFYQQIANGVALVLALALNQLGTGSRR